MSIDEFKNGLSNNLAVKHTTEVITGEGTLYEFEAESEDGLKITVIGHNWEHIYAALPNWVKRLPRGGYF